MQNKKRVCKEITWKKIASAQIFDSLTGMETDLEVIVKKMYFR